MSFSVDLQALDQTIRGIDDALTVLREEGTAGAERSGQAVQDWGLVDSDAGHDDLTDALGELLVRCRFVVRDLVAHTEETVDTLRETGKTYRTVDEEIGNTFSDIVGKLGAEAQWAGNTVFGAPKTQGGK